MSLHLSREFSNVAGSSINLPEFESDAPDFTARTSPPLERSFEKDQSLRQRFGLRLEAFGAGIRGQEPLAFRLRRQEQQRKAQDIQILSAKFTISANIMNNAKNLTGQARQNFVNRAANELDDVDPEFGDMVRGMADKPENFAVLPDIFKTPLIQSIFAQGGSAAVIKFATSPQGQKHLESAADQKFLPIAWRKIPSVISWVEKNKPNLLKKIRKDGKTTVSELQQINDAVPQTIKLSNEEFSTATVSRNQKGLLQFGITTDEVLAQQAKEMAKAKGAKGGRFAEGIKTADANSINALGAAMFKGLYNQATGGFSFKNKKDRTQALNLIARAQRIFLDAKGKLVHGEAVKQAARELGVTESATKTVSDVKPGEQTAVNRKTG